MEGETREQSGKNEISLLMEPTLVLTYYPLNEQQQRLDATVNHRICTCLTI